MKPLPESVIKILDNPEAHKKFGGNPLYFANYFILNLVSMPQFEENELIYIITAVLKFLKKSLKGEERLSFKADLLKLLNSNEKIIETEEFKIQTKERGVDYKIVCQVMENFRAKKEYYLNLIDKKWNP